MRWPKRVADLARRLRKPTFPVKVVVVVAIGSAACMLVGALFVVLAHSAPFADNPKALLILSIVVGLAACLLITQLVFLVLHQFSMHEALRALSARVESAREAERLRIAHDIHDALGSTLTALKLELAGTPSLIASLPGVRRRHRRASVELVDSALETVKGVIAQLRTPEVNRFGLWEGLHLQAERVQARLNFPCRFSVAPDVPEPSGDLAIALYRIVEEALTNVARHAEASNIDVTAQLCGTQLEVTVRDDGRGIPEDRVDSLESFGLFGMRERARLWDATVRISRNDGPGTAVVVRVPLGKVHESIVVA